MNYSILALDVLKAIRDAKLRLHEKCAKRNVNYKGTCLDDLNIIEGCIALKENRGK